MMAQSWAESTWEINTYGKYINQYGNMKGSTRKYVNRKCLLYSMKFVLMKKSCQNIHIYHHHHHHHVVPSARISLTLSHNFSLSFIASGKSSGLHPVSSHSCCMYVQAGCPAFARPYEGVHRRTLLMSSSLLLQQCPACLVRLTWIVFMMGSRWPYSWCFVGCCLQDLFKIARSILV